NNGVGGSVSVPAVASLAAQPGAPSFTGVFQSSLTFSWATNANSASTLYQIKRATQSTGPFIVSQTVGPSSVVETGLVPATNYSYLITALNLNGVVSTASTVGSTLTLTASAPSISGTLSYGGTQKGVLQVQLSNTSAFVPVLSSATLPNAA